MKYRLFILILTYIFAFGCSSGGSGPISPNNPESQTTQGSHYTWGLWQFTADPAKGTLDIVPLRKADMHLNALVFLEPPPLVNLTLESLKFNGNIVDADIGLRHPFIGLNEFTGFDVCGVLITQGSKNGFSDSSITMTGEGDTRLLNPDGFTRWWNPAEFPHANTMFGYKDGLLGTPDSSADYNSTVNAYKFFTDDLTDPNSPVSSIDPTSRCIFSAGKKNIRHYSIDMGSSLVFNYAVDASWVMPQGSPPWKVPDDFPSNANRPEAWNAIVTETENTLWNDGIDKGGQLALSIDLWDHYNAGLNTIYVESPGNFPLAGPISPTGGGGGYSTYIVDIKSATPAAGSIDILITAECETEDYQDLLPGKKVAAYFLHTADVSPEEPVPPADPIQGNVLLKVLRDENYVITGVQLNWTGNGNPEYAVYADTNPYDSVAPTTFIIATPAETIDINTANYVAFSSNGAYVFTVRARSVAGSSQSESTDSEYAFVDMEDFDGGSNPEPWGLYYMDSGNQLQVTSGTIDGNCLQMGPSPNNLWTAAVSPMLPGIADSEYSVIEVAQRASNFQDNPWPECLAAMYANTTVGWADALPINGDGTWKSLHTPPLDAAIDGTWQLEDQLNPDCVLVSIAYFFGGDSSTWRGWRVYFLDNAGDPPPIRFSRVTLPQLHTESNVYASWAYGQQNTYPDNIGLVEPTHCDELAVIIY